MKMFVKTGLLILCVYILCSVAAEKSYAVTKISDTAGREVFVPDKVERVICSGPGALRLISYFKAQDKVVAVDDMEKRKNTFDARPYAIAHAGYKTLPVFGGFRGQDDPEKILGLDKLPQVIFKTYPDMGYNPDELQQKTGIPVVVLDYGDLDRHRKELFDSINLIGRVLKQEKRAADLIGFFSAQIEELEKRTKALTNKKTCFVGGIAFKGPHGFQSTEPYYPPFEFVNADNIAASGRIPGKNIRQSNFSKEKILMTDPDILFLDLSTLQMGDQHSGLFELKNDPVYQALTAVKEKRVYGVLPYNWYTQNLGSVLADAWYIGKIICPEQFSDIQPEKKADEIYEFLLSAKVFKEMNQRFKNMAFLPVNLTGRE